MLRLSQQQYQALHDDAIKRWRERLAVWLREHAEPARAMSDADLLALIDRQERRAARYGIDTELALAKWCLLALMTSERFENDPEAAEILTSADYLSAQERIDTILRYADQR